MERQIATFSPSGGPLRRYSLSAIERLLSMDRVVVKRNHHGRIVEAIFRQADGASPVRATAHLGTAYSFEEPLPSGHYAWRHRALVRDESSLEALFGELPDDRQDAELYVKAIFRAVPLSCMARPKPLTPPTKTPGKVLPFAAGKRKPKAAAASRPLEFDSQWRKAA